MGSQVAVAEVAVVPTFKGFRRKTTAETEGAARESSRGFSRIFAKTGTDTGKTVGSGFKKAFEQSSKGLSDKVTKALEADVAKASRALSTARLKEQDAIGKVRLAQAQLNEANQKYEKDSSQVIRAQERLATASRQLETAHEGTERATDDLKRAQGELARAADRAGDEIADAGDRGVKGFRSNVVGGVRGFAGPLVAAFAALGIGSIVADAFREAKDFVLQSITLASGLEQSIGGVDAIFKESAEQIHGWAKGAADAVGLSRNQYNELSTVIGSQLKNMGVPLDEVAGKTNNLIGLAADLAATYGGTTADAVSAVSSLLRGERDPIERYGVSISDAVLEAGLLAKGLDDLEGPARDEAKRQETLAALYAQTADAQGAFGREFDTLAGKQQRAAAEWENIRTELGEAFLPVMSDMASILREDVLPVIAELVEKHGPELAEAFAEALPSLTELARELLPELPGLIKSFADALPAVIGFLSVVTPMLIGFMTAGNNVMQAYGLLFGLLSGNTSFEEFRQDLLSIEGPIGDVLRWVDGLTGGWGTDMLGMAVTTRTKIGEIIGFIQSLPQKAKDAVAGAGKWLVASGKALIDGFIRGMRQSPVGSAVKSILDWVRGFFPNSPAKRGPLSGSGWTKLRQSGAAYWEQWVDGMGGDGPTFPGFPGAPGGSPALPSGSGVAPASAAAVYVQNPWGPEYMRAQTADVARGASAEVVRTSTVPFKRGGRRR